MRLGEEKKKVSKIIKLLLAGGLETLQLQALYLMDKKTKKKGLCHKLFLIMAIACFKVGK